MVSASFPRSGHCRSSSSDDKVRTSPKIGNNNKLQPTSAPTPHISGGSSTRRQKGRTPKPPRSPSQSPKITREEALRNGSPFKTWKQRRTESDFNEYTELSQRLTKSMYYAKRMPTLSRPSFPLTVLAVNAFTSTKLGTKLDTLEFLDLELASEIGINACVSPTTLIMTLVYLERLHYNNPDYLHSIKPSELFAISLLVASKFIQDDGEDCGIYNDEWAASAGMETKDVNRLEIEFLTAIDWNVNVSREEFDKALQILEYRLAQQEAQKRGSFTYAELEKVSKALLTWNLIWPIVYDYTIKVIVAASITYATLVTTLLTSAVVAPNMVQYLTRSLTTTKESSLLPSSASRVPVSGFSQLAPIIGNGHESDIETEADELLHQILDLDFNNTNTIRNNLLQLKNMTNAFNYIIDVESQKCTQPDSCSKFDNLNVNAVLMWSSFNTELHKLSPSLQLQQFDSFSPIKFSKGWIDNYQNRFQTLYDSCSTDDTVKLARPRQWEGLGSFVQFVTL